MKENYRKALLENYLELFVEKKKESDMLIASGRGLLSKVAEMIDDSFWVFKNKGLKVKSGQENVRYWLIKSEAKANNHNEIQVVLGLACSPAEIKGRVRLTKKEAEIVSKLQKIWDYNLKYGYFYDSDKYKMMAEELYELSHHLECYRGFSFNFGMDDFYRKDDLLSRDYVFCGLTDDPYSVASTQDLLPIRVLFEKTE